MIYLASQSPRRRELLEQIKVKFGILDISVPEIRMPGEPPMDYVRRVAREKAGAGLLAMSGVKGPVIVAADTEVVLDDTVFGKPESAQHAREMLTTLSGKEHQVISAVCVIGPDREGQRTSETFVQFAQLSKSQIDMYIASGEWQGKAGAYAIQGIAARFIKRIVGSYSGVMGLPLFETSELLMEFGVHE